MDDRIPLIDNHDIFMRRYYDHNPITEIWGFGYVIKS